MRKLAIGGAMLCLNLFFGCSDDDEEFFLEEEQLTGRDWFYNGCWDRWDYSSNDVVEVLYFSTNHDVMEKEFAGRQTTRRGTWSTDENNLIMNWEDERENWRVLDCNKNTLSVIGWGAREYTSDENLRSLTGDAYWVNEFNGTAGSEGFTTRLGFSLAGNKNVRDAYVLLSDTEEGRVKLEKSGEAWGGKIEHPNEDVRVRFSCRIGSGDFMKFDDEVGKNNFDQMSWNDINVKWGNLDKGENGINVSWNSLAREGVYYQVTIYAEGDELNPYFVSSLLEGERNSLDITTNTMGVINRLNEVKADTPCKARLSVILLESGVGAGDVYTSVNLQAVLYATAVGNFSNVF